MIKDIIIIGGGPAGYEAALYGARYGGNMTLIEDHKIGGTCLNYGCIPTKTLIERGALYNKMIHASDMGILHDHVEVDYESMQKQKTKIISDLAKGIMGQLKKEKVNYIEGFATIENRKTVSVTLSDGSIRRFVGDAIVLATGSKSVIPNIKGIENERILTSKDILEMKRLPASITIVGGGVIGMEFASMLSHMGVKVSVIEYEKNILPTIDSSISKRLKSLCQQAGIDIHTGSKVIGFESLPSDMDDTEVNKAIRTIFLEKEKEVHIDSEYVLLSVGRMGVWDQETIEELGITHNNRFIQVDANYETSVEGIYAIGDVNGLSLLAHAAYNQGRQLMGYLLKNQNIHSPSIPGCIFTDPEIGSIGLSEEEAKEKGVKYKSQKTLYGASGKAMAMNATTGFIKSLISEDGKIMGLHILGAHSTDLIHYGIIAMEGGLTIHQLQDMVFAHPTLGELFSDHVHSYYTF
ncbi:dihydrolipoyl dehydrogenase [Petrocella sp. FN5]|uniref:dihydrolipoyl dehydrogenase n=1 Tax=Petrocella sp. FN5 TaxID=3032002 RepID=UPI0023D9A09A|nr:dihydrolipoyl dehydrogenase [Petrocella sp. FN5]MDF1617969.1 dihydrolipoyl dehydrogenase [Petrocella sp. FN5]